MCDPAPFLPDAAEALVQIGRLDEAGEIIARLEANGARLDRAWMLAVGARCRAMLLAAGGDLAGAAEAADRLSRVRAVPNAVRTRSAVVEPVVEAFGDKSPVSDTGIFPVVSPTE
jgi:hypothetical protein